LEKQERQTEGDQHSDYSNGDPDVCATHDDDEHGQNDDSTDIETENDTTHILSPFLNCLTYTLSR
jgi:hypothetical protein